MKLLGAALMLLGGAVVVVGGLRSENPGRSLQLRDVRVAATSSARIPPSPVAGVVPLVLGAGMLMRDSRRLG